MKKPRFLQIRSRDNEWIWPKQRNLSLGCCDCGLTHSVSFRAVRVKDKKRTILNPKEYQVEFIQKRNNIMTEKVRAGEIETYGQ